MREKKLFLLDGNSLLYRSYYAIRRLTNSKGFPTNAIYGFLLTLRKILEKEKPSFLAIVFDTGRPTLRHKAFQEYKAQRKPMPEDLIVQVPVLKKVLQAYNIPLLEYENYEADDVLGSLASQASRLKVPTVIVSTDKDLLQLVDETTAVYNPAKDVLLDREGVEESFGVPPSQVVDVLSLWGDPSDNIPGVPGIGEKTSKELIREFGSLDNLLKNLEKIKNPRVRERVEKNIPKLELSRKLVTVERGLPLALRLEDFAVSPPDREALRTIFQELEFSSLLEEYAPPAPAPAQEYKALFSLSEIRSLVQRIREKKSLSLDTETDSVFPTQARLVGLSFSLQAGEAFYLPLGHDYPGAPSQVPKDKAYAALREVLADPRIKKMGQNIKYDLIVLRREGLELSGIDKDSMVLSYLLEPNWGKHNKEKLASAYLQIQALPYSSVAGKGKKQTTLNAVEVEKVTPYACQDADLALRLCDILWAKVKERGLDRLYEEIELPLIEVLADMEMAGVRVDPQVLRRLSQELEQDLRALKKKIFELSGEEFNIHSPQQLARILFHKLQLPATKKTKITREYSTSWDILQELAGLHPLAQYALEYRQLAKLKSTYADALASLIHPATGRIHTSYNQTVTATGRLSSSDPNLQNIPARGEMGRRFRQAFIPADGALFLSADYSQIELRVLAHLSEDPALVESFVGGRDIHAETARRVFGSLSAFPEDEQRRRAKIINFSMIYGASAFSLARELGTSPAEAQSFIDVYFKTYPRVAEFLEEKVQEARDKGYSQTLFGRQRQVPELRLADKNIQQAGRRIALNTPIQGTAADLMKKAMVDVWRALRKRKLQTRMILQVHDELVFEVPEAETEEVEALVRRIMENVHPLRVPLKVRLAWGINWAEAK